MTGARRTSSRHTGLARGAVTLLLAATVSGCSAASMFGSRPEATPAAAPAAEAPPTPTPPPLDLAGRWQLAAAAGGACLMTFGDAAGGATAAAAVAGTIAPEGGCPGNFFTSRKWSFENGALIIRDFKGRQLAQLTYVGGHFEGSDKNGGALTLSKQL